MSDRGALVLEWRGDFDNAELNALHAEAFEHRVLIHSACRPVKAASAETIVAACAHSTSTSRLSASRRQGGSNGHVPLGDSEFVCYDVPPRRGRTLVPQ